MGVLLMSLILQVSMELNIMLSPIAKRTFEPDINGATIVPAPLTGSGESGKTTSRVSASERRRIFKQIIVKCVLQLLLIETTNELLQNKDVYDTIPPEHLDEG